MSLAVAAASMAPLGFGFTGGGFLLTYFLGVIQALLESGALVPGVTPVAGGSAGALAAVTACSGESGCVVWWWRRRLLRLLQSART